MAGALALLIFVVAAIGALLAVDLGRTEHRHWLDAFKSWQQLIGAVLGFLGAAGVLVLSTAIQQDSDMRKSAAAAHEIGLGLAYEVESMGIGLKTGQAIGTMIDLASPTIQPTCVSYATTMQRVLEPSTPVYTAVLPRMVDFGDANLELFVRFYAIYASFLRELPDEISEGCAAAPVEETRYMIGQVGHAMDLYAIIARNYGITPADAGIPAAADATSDVSSAPASGG